LSSQGTPRRAPGGPRRAPGDPRRAPGTNRETKPIYKHLSGVKLPIARLWRPVCYINNISIRQAFGPRGVLDNNCSCFDCCIKVLILFVPRGLWSQNAECQSLPWCLGTHLFLIFSPSFFSLIFHVFSLFFLPFFIGFWTPSSLRFAAPAIVFSCFSPFKKPHFFYAFW